MPPKPWSSSVVASGLNHDAEPLAADSHFSRPKRHWVDPHLLPNYARDVDAISGTASSEIKQLTANTLIAYGVGSESCFAHNVGKARRLLEVNVEQNVERMGRREASTVAEIVVNEQMLNGAGAMHGGCLAYIIDNCCSTPLVALGIHQGRNGVGVTQSLSITYHTPATTKSALRIISTSVTFGLRIMSARCEVVDKFTGRIVASATMNKMQPIARA